MRTILLAILALCLGACSSDTGEQFSGDIGEARQPLYVESLNGLNGDYETELYAIAGTTIFAYIVQVEVAASVLADANTCAPYLESDLLNGFHHTQTGAGFFDGDLTSNPVSIGLFSYQQDETVNDNQVIFGVDCTGPANDTIYRYDVYMI